jgi:hypothetical protein
MKNTIAALVIVAGAASAALAGSVTGTGSLDLYGRSYSVTTWNIVNDAQTNRADSEFGAEGMTFHNGVLYVSHDHNANRSASRLVQYTPGPTGNLTTSSITAMGAGPNGTWGPEGITVNTSGSGFGAFGPSDSVRIVGLDSRGSGAFGVFNTGAPGSAQSPTASPSAALDDVAFVGSLDKFAGVEEVVDPLGGPDSSLLRFYDKTSMTLESFSFEILAGAKGLTVVSAAFAELLTGTSVDTDQAFIVVTEFDGFAIYDTNGNLRRSALTFGDYAPIEELESIAVDEANNLIFLGDEAGNAIHVVSVPTPGAIGVLGLAGVVVARRRRR